MRATLDSQSDERKAESTSESCDVIAPTAKDDRSNNPDVVKATVRRHDPSPSATD